MPRDAGLSVNERQFIRRALFEAARLDGRAPDESRPLSITFGQEHGVADVTLGKTRVLVRISAEVATPNPDRKFDGIFQIATELSPIASPSFEANSRPSETELVLSRILEKTIRRSGALDTESLCIVAGNKCWAVRADVHVLVHDGALVDAACVATVAALLHYRRPDVEVHGEDVTVYSPREREPVALAMQLVPFCVSFSVFGPGAHDGPGVSGDEVVIVDAALSEERACDATVVVGMDRHGQLCQIVKHGGLPVDAQVVHKCMQLALDKVKTMHALVHQRLHEDALSRDVGGLIAELRAENER